MTRAVSLDTCMLSERDFIRWIRENNVPAVISPVAYMERRRQLLSAGKDPALLDQLLREARIKVTQFDKGCAERASEYMAMQAKVCDRCGKLDWADVMILSCIESPMADLVTLNTRDFEPYGPGDRVRTPRQAMSGFMRW